MLFAGVSLDMAVECKSKAIGGEDNEAIVNQIVDSLTEGSQSTKQCWFFFSSFIYI